MELASFLHKSGTLEERLSVALAKLTLVGRSALGQVAWAGSLSPLQSLILERLARVGTASVGELARLFGVTAPTVSDSLTSLERKKLVVRRSEGRGRRVEVCATTRGKQLAQQQLRWTEVFSEAVAECSETEQAVLLNVLLRMIAKLVAQGVIAEARLCVTCQYFQPHVRSDSSHPHHCAFVDLPLSDAHLRVDCPDHQPSSSDEVQRRLEALRRGGVYSAAPGGG